jgi:hypothetical protein
MTFLMVAAHGASGWLDEVIELGIPLLVLVVLYFWSNRNPAKTRATSGGAPVQRSEATRDARSELDERGRGGDGGTANAGPQQRDE